MVETIRVTPVQALPGCPGAAAALAGGLAGGSGAAARRSLSLR
jgi:hypothetical protein